MFKVPGSEFYKVFSFRAEYAKDATTFQAEAVKQNILIQITKMSPAFPDHPHIDDRMVQICSMRNDDGEYSVITIEMLRNVLRGIIDSRIMLESLRECPVEENTGSRDRSIQ